MTQGLFTALLSGLFLGPYSFLGVELLSSKNNNIVWYYAASMFGDICGSMFLYCLGYYFEKKLGITMKFLRLKKEHLTRAKQTLERKTLFLIFLLTPITPHPVDAALYLMCGLLKMSISRFFLNIFLASAILSSCMILFGDTLQAIITYTIDKHFPLTVSLFILTLCTLIIIGVYIFFTKRTKSLPAKQAKG